MSIISTWPIFELTQAFIPNLLICKFQEHPIITKGLMLMTRSKIGIFTNLGIDRPTWLVFKLSPAFNPSLHYM